MAHDSSPPPRTVMWIVGIIAALLVAAFAAAQWSIYSGIRSATEAAQREHPGDSGEALIAFVESNAHTLRERNRAVWALGQLRYEPALPVLEARYTGKECNHSEALCQHELEKAITLIRHSSRGSK